MPGTGLYCVKAVPAQHNDTLNGPPVGQVITLTTGGLGAADAYKGGYVTNTTRGHTRSIVSHTDTTVTLEGLLGTWLNTDVLQCFDSWATIQGACDRLWTDQGGAIFTAMQEIRVYDGTYAEALLIPGLAPRPRYRLKLVNAAGNSPTLNADTLTYAIKSGNLKFFEFSGFTVAGNVTSYVFDMGVYSTARHFHDLTVTSDSVVFDTNYAGGLFKDCRFVTTAAVALQWSYHAGTKWVGCTFEGYSTVHTCGYSVIIEGCTYKDCGTILKPSTLGYQCHIVFRNNTVHNATFFVYEGYALGTLSVLNNVFHIVTNLYYEDYVYTDVAFLSLLPDYNCYHGITAYLNHNALPDVTTFAGWQALGYDANSMEADPLMTNPSAGDFTLQATSPCIAAGVGAGVPYDVNGDDFDMHLPDIGAASTGVKQLRKSGSGSAVRRGTTS